MDRDQRIVWAAIGGALLYGMLGQSFNSVMLGAAVGGIVAWGRGYINQKWPFPDDGKT